MAGHGNRLLTYPEKFITVKELTGVAIQAAIDECVDGGSVFIPAGVYEIDSPIYNIAKAITIFGSGVETELKLSDNRAEGVHNIFYLSYDNCTICSMYLNGNKANQANLVESHGINIVGTGGHIIRDCFIANNKGTFALSGGDGIYIVGACGNIVIDNNRIIDNDDDGIDCLSGSVLSNSRIVNNKISGNGDNGIDTEGCDYCVIANNVIYDNLGNGIEVEEESSGGGTCLHNTVTGNVVYGCNNGIALRSARYTSVVSNTIHSCGVGILVDKTVNGDTSLYNTIVGNVISDSDTYGIEEVSGETGNNIFSSNKVVGSGTADYLIDGTNSVSFYEEGGIHKFDKSIAVTGNADADSITSRLATLTADGDAAALVLVRGTDDSSVGANIMNVYENDGVTLLFGIQYDGRIYVASNSAVPTIVVGSAAGVGATVTVDATSTDGAGKINLAPAGTPTSGLQCTLTFSRAYNIKGIPSLTPANIQTAGLMVSSLIFCESPNSTTFTIWAGNALPIQALEFFYNVKGV